MGRWTAIIILGLAQFIMVLDGTVMNVSITTVVTDLDTTVQMMQLAIATFALTMAALMLTGAGMGDRLGRRRTFVIGLCIYAVGSFITAVAGVFFILPLYLQTVLGLDALGSGVRILPMSVALFIMALVGSRLFTRISPRTLVQVGLALGVVGVALLLTAIGPQLTGWTFGIAMTVLGAGLGLAFSQLGNVNLSAADVTRSSEVGGLQGTMQNLGMSLGTALAESVLFIGLIATFNANLSKQPAATTALEQQATEATASGIGVVPASDVRSAVTTAGLPPDQVDAVVTAYEDGKLQALRAALLIVAVVGLVGLLLTGKLPKAPLTDSPSRDGPAAASAGSPRTWSRHGF